MLTIELHSCSPKFPDVSDWFSLRFKHVCPRTGFGIHCQVSLLFFIIHDENQKVNFCDILAIFMVREDISPKSKLIVFFLVIFLVIFLKTVMILHSKSELERFSSDFSSFFKVNEENSLKNEPFNIVVTEVKPTQSELLRVF